MAVMSVAEAAERLAVSPARVRQRIESGSLVASKVGGRWLVDLDASGGAGAPLSLGRPVEPASVWWSLIVGQQAQSQDLAKRSRPVERHVADAIQIHLRHAEMALDDAESVAKRWGADRLSRSSRERAVRRVASAAEGHDVDALLGWLRWRAVRRLLVAAPADLDAIREDNRVLVSGVSHPESGMEDPRIAEGYVAADDIDAVVADHWLEDLRVGEKPNVILHVALARPRELMPILLAADLAEHQGPREVIRAQELAGAWLDALRRAPGEQAKS